jgi:tetratricopeptide (TPR) repeat protein/predicted Ser/Thr protein kinase
VTYPNPTPAGTSAEAPVPAPRMRFAHFLFDPVQDLLGEGPLSEVYRAVDEKLGREVALKILRAHVEIDPEADQRFEREARHTSELAHPNIATIYEYGSDSGRSYIAMELLQGRTLDKIIKSKSLGVEDCLRIAVQLTSALARVHKSGLIHRDLKPANVMVLHDGTVKLLDFGIARNNNEATITQHGMLVGTVLYMSPEQVRGDDLDARSDIFSLGAVLYHALTGALPFPGNSFPEVCMSILDGKPKPPSQIRSGLPAGLEEFILRCLSPNPDARYPDAEAAHGVLMALADGLASGTGIAQASFLTGTLCMPPISVPDSAPNSNPAAGADGAAGGFAQAPPPEDGAVDHARALAASLRKDLAAELSRAGMAVTLLDVERIPSEVHTDFVLRAALKVEGPRASLTVVLERRRNGGSQDTTEVWRQQFEDSESDEWALQAQLVRSAARAIRRQLAEHVFKSSPDQAVRNPIEARNLALRGHELLHRGMTRHLLASISSFRRALEEDPQCAIAYAGLSEALARKYLYWDGDEAFLGEARDHAKRSLALDPGCAEAHTSLGFAYHLTGHSVDAQREYRLAIQLNHNEWLAHRLLGSLLSREGNLKAASPLLQRAISIKSTYISSYDHLYNVLQRLDRYEESLQVADRGIAAAKRQINRVPDDQDARLHLAMLLARIGRRDEALEELAQAHRIAPKDGFTSFHTASVHSILANPVEALEALQAAQSRGYYIRAEQRNSEFDLLRGLPQFQALVQ